ncbi:MAG TPA: hypothetical protein VEK07_24805, partial [Polyangiaceae bacterium]|nr:hypothetical protein [Polyangiaceae bacterium]
ERVRARSRAQGLPHVLEVSSGAVVSGSPPARAAARGPEPAYPTSGAAAADGPRIAVRPEPAPPVVESVDIGASGVSRPEGSLGESTWTPVPPAGEPEIVIDVEEPEAARTAARDGVDIAESVPEAESDQRLRAAEGATSEPEVEAARSMSPSDVSGTVDASPSASSAELEPEAPTRAVDAPDEEERAPASSRRPVALAAEDHLAQMAFGSEESAIPHHTPPPESGRLPSAAVDEFDDATGIRGARVEETGRKVIAHLAAESTRANLERNDLVVDTVGEARRFAPATFLELLEASLEL